MIKSWIGAASLASLAACVVHVHVHEAQREGAVPATSPVTASQAVSSAPANESHTDSSTVSGIVVDASGAPVRARIALVWANGSMAMSCNEAGRFSMDPPASEAVVVHASTEDGRVAIRRVRGGEETRLVLAPGGTIAIDFTSEQDMRCAVFQGELRIEDFTLRARSDSRKVVVPAGDVHLRVYGGGKSPSGGPGYTNDQRVTIAEGDTQSVKFTVGALHS